MAECSSGNENLEEIKSCRICMKKLQEPLRLQCIHSFCKTCLEGTAKVEMDGKLGWNCQTCGMFSDETETKEDVLLQRLIDMEEDKYNKEQEAQVCEFCDEGNAELMFCNDCRMVICDRCKRTHLKSPTNKHHDIGNKDDVQPMKEGIIDEVVFCSKHNLHMVETVCETCNELLCKICLKDHFQHALQTIEQSLTKRVMDMDICLDNITTKMTICDRQVEALNDEILNVKETYAKWRIDSDLKLEILINRLKASKALLDEKVNDEESRNLDILKGIKTKIQNQSEQCRIVSVIANLTKMRTRHLSQMKEFQSGLLKQIYVLKNLEVHIGLVHIKTPYMEERLYDYTDEELSRLLRPVKYLKTEIILDQSVNTMDQNKTKEIYEDLNAYLSQEFFKTTTFNLVSYSFRVNNIGVSLYVGQPERSLICQFNTAGQCVKEYYNTQKTLVVKQAENGDIIAGGRKGLHATNIDFDNWFILQSGSYCDIVMQGNVFTAIDHKEHKVETYERSQIHGNKRKWELKSFISITPQQRNNLLFHEGTSLAVNSIDNTLVVCCNNTLVVYSNSGQHVKTITLLSCYYKIIGMDGKGNLVLGDYDTGHVYSIKDVQHLNVNSMEQYLIFQKCSKIYDMTVDCDGNLWILNADAAYNLTKYVPRK